MRRVLLAPALRQAGEGQGRTVGAAEVVRLLAAGLLDVPLVEAVGGHDDAAGPEGVAEGGLGGHRLAAHVEETAARGGVLGPPGDEAPAEGHEQALGLGTRRGIGWRGPVPHPEDQVGRGHVPARVVGRLSVLGQGRLEVAGQPGRRGVEGEASAHAGCIVAYWASVAAPGPLNWAFACPGRFAHGLDTVRTYVRFLTPGTRRPPIWAPLGVRRARELPAGLADRVRPVTPVAGRTLPVPPPLAPLFPDGRLRRGTTTTVAGSPATGSTTLALALLAAASAAGSWCAAVGLPDPGVVAAAGLGLDLRRVVFVPHPGTGWAEAAGDLLSGVDAVLVRPPGRARPPRRAIWRPGPASARPRWWCCSRAPAAGPRAATSRSVRGHGRVGGRGPWSRAPARPPGRGPRERAPRRRPGSASARCGSPPDGGGGAGRCGADEDDGLDARSPAAGPEAA